MIIDLTLKTLKGFRQSNKGQTLLIVVVLMVITLSIGIIMSERFIKSIRSSVQGDEASRALHMAEAAAENILIKTTEELEDYIDNNSCGSNCVLEITDISGNVLTANVSLSYLGDSEEPFIVSASSIDSAQILMEGYGSGSTADICWDSPTPVFANYIFDDGGVIKANSYAFNNVGYNEQNNEFGSAVTNHGHTNCFTILTNDSPKMIRFKTFEDESEIYIIPAAGQLIPRQGILIESYGTSGETTRKLSIIRTSGRLPQFFDYVIYQTDPTKTLSN